MHMNGERKIRLEDISFESEAFNIYDPFFSSESDNDYTNSSLDSLSSYDSETFRSSAEADSSCYTSEERGYSSQGILEDIRCANLGRLTAMSTSLAPLFATHQVELSSAEPS